MKSLLIMIVKSRFCFVLCIILLFNVKSIYPLVIFLNGTSSAGKSSIAIEIHRQLKGEFQLFRLDGYRGEISFKDAVEQAALKGENIIVDAIVIDSNIISFLKNIDVCFVLVYCPFSSLIEHVKERNISANGGKRTLFRVLNQFCLMYKLAQQDCLDDISYQNVVYGASLVEDPKKRQELCMLFKNKFFINHDTSIITSEMSYDVIVNTSKRSSKQCAEQIISYVHSSTEYSEFKKNFCK